MDLTSSDKNWRRKFETLAQKEREDYKVVMVWSKVGLENYRNYFFEYFRPHIQEDNSQISILDVGCGPGMYVSLLAQKGFQIHGVDYSEEMIAMAKIDIGNAVSRPTKIITINRYQNEMDIERASARKK